MYLHRLSVVGLIRYRGITGAISRDDLTRLINDSFDIVEWNGKRKCRPKVTGRVFEEVQERQQQSFMKQSQDGVGYDEAKSKCGNSDEQLNDAVATGRVTRFGEWPGCVYFFRRVELGMQTKHSISEKSTVSYAGNDFIHNTMQTAQLERMDEVRDFAENRAHGAAAGTAGQPNLCIQDICSGSAGQPSSSSPQSRTCQDLLRRCEAQQAQLKKVYKLADTAEERYGKYASACPRVRTQLDLLKGECEKTDEIFSKYSKASKYGKEVDGKPITSAYLGALLGEMEMQFQSMCGDVKSVKHYIPQVPKEKQ